MPIYTVPMDGTSQLSERITELEKGGERIVQVFPNTGKWQILTEPKKTQRETRVTASKETRG